MRELRHLREENAKLKLLVSDLQCNGMRRCAPPPTPGNGPADRTAMFDHGYADVGLKAGEQMKWGIINRKGTVLLKPISDAYIVITEGMAGIKIGDKYGYAEVPGT